jgi:hypothetical protein
MSRYFDAKVTREGERYLAAVDECNAFTYADSVTELRANVMEAVEAATGVAPLHVSLQYQWTDDSGEVYGITEENEQVARTVLYHQGADYASLRPVTS